MRNICTKMIILREIREEGCKKDDDELTLRKEIDLSESMCGVVIKLIR